MRSAVLIVCLFLSGCSVGPFHLTHNEGELPKAKVDMPVDECKLRPRGNISNGIDEVVLTCTYDFDFRG